MEDLLSNVYELLFRSHSYDRYDKFLSNQSVSLQGRKLSIILLNSILDCPCLSVVYFNTRVQFAIARRLSAIFTSILYNCKIINSC
jgi:hypothetical protein